MRVQRKHSTEVRRGALYEGAERLVGGCSACADGYFLAARQHGATDAEIQAAIAAARERSEQLALKRRDFLKTMLVAGTGMALATLLPSPSAGAAGAAVLDTAAVVWVRCGRTVGADKAEPYPYRLVGVHLSGKIVAEINPLRGAVRFDAQGQAMYITSQQQTASNLTTIIDHYDAASGKFIRTLNGAALRRPRTDPQLTLESDAVQPVLTPDGRFLALLHEQRRAKPGTLRTASKYLPIYIEPQERVFGTPEAEEVEFVTADPQDFLSLELIDLASGQSSGEQDISVGDDFAGGAELIFGPDGRGYLSFTAGAYQTSVLKLEVADGKFSELSRVTGTSARPVVPFGSGGVSQPTRFTAKADQLLRFIPARSLAYIDVATMTLARSVDIGEEETARPAHPLALFSPDGSSLYVLNNLTAGLRVVDVAQGTVAATAAFAGSGIPVRRASMAMSADGRALILLDGQELGAAIIDPTTLRMGARVLADHVVQAVVGSSDPALFVAVLAGTDGTMVVLDTAGQAVAGVQVGTAIFEVMHP